MSEPVIEIKGLRKTFRDFWLRPTVAAVDALEDRRERARQEYGCDVYADYHELFDDYHKTESLEDFVQLFAFALIESLHKRITLLGEHQTITITEWAEKNHMAQNSALNKARRQTIPAFRQNKTWMIRADFKDSAGVELY